MTTLIVVLAVIVYLGLGVLLAKPLADLWGESATSSWPLLLPITLLFWFFSGLGKASIWIWSKHTTD